MFYILIKIQHLSTVKTMLAILLLQDLSWKIWNNLVELNIFSKIFLIHSFALGLHIILIICHLREDPHVGFEVLLSLVSVLFNTKQVDERSAARDHQHVEQCHKPLKDKILHSTYSTYNSLFLSFVPPTLILFKTLWRWNEGFS